MADDGDTYQTALSSDAPATDPSQDAYGYAERGGFMAFPNRWRLTGLTNHLLGRIPVQGRSAVLRTLIANGRAFALTVNTVDYLAETQAGSTAKPSSFDGLDAGLADELKTEVATRLKAEPLDTFLSMSELAYVLVRVQTWVGAEALKAKFAQHIRNDGSLPMFLEKFLRIGSSHSEGDRVTREIYNLNPQNLKGIADIFELEGRVELMLNRSDLTTHQRAAGKCYLKSMGLIRNGKDPDSFDFSDLIESE